MKWTRKMGMYHAQVNETVHVRVAKNDIYELPWSFCIADHSTGAAIDIAGTPNTFNNKNVAMEAAEAYIQEKLKNS